MPFLTIDGTAPPAADWEDIKECHYQAAFNTGHTAATAFTDMTDAEFLAYLKKELIEKPVKVKKQSDHNGTFSFTPLDLS